MPKLKRSEMRFLDEVFNMAGGYPLDFSNRTFAEFFEDEFGITIYQERYAFNGTSKANHLRSFIEIENGFVVGKVLRKLLEHRDILSASNPLWIVPDGVRFRVSEMVARIEASSTSPVLSALSESAGFVSFDTVSRDLDRALKSAEQDPEDAVTAACSTVESVCRSILIELGLDLPDKKDIKGLFNAVKRPLGLSADRTDIDQLIADDVRKVLSGIVTVVEGVGALRTHGGDAHGRERGYARLDARIARLAIHSASTVTLFLIETWQKKFPDRALPKRAA